MKAHYQKILINDSQSFIAKELDLPYFDGEFHFHPEFELKFVTHSKGKRFIGDDVDNFNEGDLVFIGPNIPHYWKNDPIYYERDDLKASAYLVMFPKDFLGNRFFLLPEMNPILDLLERAKTGIYFSHLSKNIEVIRLKLKGLISLEGPQRIIAFLDILFELTKADAHPLINEAFVDDLLLLNHSDHSIRRLKKVHQYVIANFHSKIQIQDVAEIANMSRYAFCKYFLKCTKKTFMTFLSELRVCHAKKLLIENHNSISYICYASGFENLSNFNRKFKGITNMTPSEFRHLYNS